MELSSFPALFIKDAFPCATPPPIIYSSLLCHRLIDYTHVGSYLGSLLCSIDLCVCFFPVPYCFTYSLGSSGFVLQNCWHYWDLLCFHTNFRNISSNPGGSDSKESTCNAGDLDLIPGLGRAPGEGHGNPH